MKKQLSTFLTKSQASRLLSPLYSGLGSILMLHRVCPPTGYKFMEANEITPDFFRSIILHLQKKGYKFISLDELQLVLTQQTKNAGKFIVITFDDGYIDNYTYAYPILKELNIPFTVYVTTNFPDNKAILWWYYLSSLVVKNRSVEIKIEGEKFKFKLESEQDQYTAFRQIRKHILTFQPNDFNTKISELFSPYFDNLMGFSKEMSMTWEQIKEIHRSEIGTIAAHTVNHFALSKLSLNDAKYEIEESRRIIEAHLSDSVEHFAYPFGTSNEASERDFELVKDLGFKTSTTTRTGNIFKQHKNSLTALPRLGIRPDRGLNKIDMFLDGLTPFIKNKGRRIITK